MRDVTESAEVCTVLSLDNTSPSGLRWNALAKPNMVGRVAGYKSTSGYWRVSYHGKAFLVHRLVWQLHYGYITDGLVVDHKDGNGFNNLVNNLRLCSQGQNTFNRKSYIRALPKGITKHRTRPGYFARVVFRGKVYSQYGLNVEILQTWLHEKRLALHKEFAHD